MILDLMMACTNKAIRHLFNWLDQFTFNRFPSILNHLYISLRWPTLNKHLNSNTKYICIKCSNIRYPTKNENESDYFISYLFVNDSLDSIDIGDGFDDWDGMSLNDVLSDSGTVMNLTWDGYYETGGGYDTLNDVVLYPENNSIFQRLSFWVYCTEHRISFMKNLFILY